MHAKQNIIQHQKEKNTKLLIGFRRKTVNSLVGVLTEVLHNCTNTTLLWNSESSFCEKKHSLTSCEYLNVCLPFNL